jgi:hypothetical protein
MKFKDFLKEGVYKTDNWNLEDITFRLEQARAQLKFIEAEMKVLSKKPIPPGDMNKKLAWDNKTEALEARYEATRTKIKNFSEKLARHQEKMRGGSDRRASH